VSRLSPEQLAWVGSLDAMPLARGIPGVGGEGGTDVAPEILSMTSIVRTVEGTPATFSVTATGTRLRYRWERRQENELEWQPVPRGYRNPLVVATPQVNVFCTQFRVTVSNSAGAATSETAYVAPIAAPPVFNKALPASVTAKAGTTLRLAVAVDPHPGLFRWYVNDAFPTWTSDAFYTVGPLALSDDGMRVRVEAVKQVGNHMCGSDGVAESKTVIRVIP
jgi:hypothetical protein